MSDEPKPTIVDELRAAMPKEDFTRALFVALSLEIGDAFFVFKDREGGTQGRVSKAICDQRVKAFPNGKSETRTITMGGKSRRIIVVMPSS